MFFTVGLIYILLFYVYSLTNIYAVNLNNTVSLIFVSCSWCILILGVVCTFPLTTLSSCLDIKKIVKKLKMQRFDNLKKEQERIKDNRLKIAYDSVMILLSTTPDYPAKHMASYLFSYSIGFINFVASLQACYSLFSLVIGGA